MEINESIATTPTQEERIMAALSHIAVLLPFMGILAPIIIWVTQKDKSKYVGFQALQALVYQIGIILVWFMGGICYMVGIFGSFIFFIPAMENEPANEALLMLPMLLPMLFMALLGLAWLAIMAYGIIAMIQSLRGKAFRYIVIGNRLEQYLGRTHLT